MNGPLPTAGRLRDVADRLQVLAVVRRPDVLGHDVDPRGHRRRERGLLRLPDQRRRVRGLERRIAREVALVLRDVVVDHEPVGEGDVLGRERLAVAPLQPVAKVARPHRVVGVVVAAGREGGRGGQVRRGELEQHVVLGGRDRVVAPGAHREDVVGVEVGDHAHVQRCVARARGGGGGGLCARGSRDRDDEHHTDRRREDGADPAAHHVLPSVRTATTSSCTSPFETSRFEPGVGDPPSNVVIRPPASSTMTWVADQSQA